nr:MAG TPA: hypothetical protein [Caudoviricetes sp.]
MAYYPSIISCFHSEVTLFCVWIEITKWKEKMQWPR